MVMDNHMMAFSLGFSHLYAYETDVPNSPQIFHFHPTFSPNIHPTSLPKWGENGTIEKNINQIRTFMYNSILINSNYTFLLTF